MASKKKAATKKVVAKKTVKKKLAVKKATSVKRIAVKKIKSHSALEIAQKQSKEDQKLWDTEPAGVPVSHFISLKTARKYVKDFNASKAPIARGAFMQPGNIRKGIFLDLLNRPEVKYLRFYFGLTKSGKVQIVFVGADAKHNDVYAINKNNNQVAQQALMVQSSSTMPPPPPPGEEGGIDMAQGCPAYGSGGTQMLPA
jgi:hypothetical protein